MWETDLLCHPILWKKQFLMLRTHDLPTPIFLFAIPVLPQLGTGRSPPCFHLGKWERCSPAPPKRKHHLRKKSLCSLNPHLFTDEKGVGKKRCLKEQVTNFKNKLLGTGTKQIKVSLAPERLQCSLGQVTLEPIWRRTSVFPIVTWYVITWRGWDWGVPVLVLPSAKRCSDLKTHNDFKSYHTNRGW